MLADEVTSAFIYAYPLFVFAQTRHNAVANEANPERHAPNTIRHNRQLSDHRSVWITAPNNDTLYSNAWLDLSFGPVRIQAGEMAAGRYWSLAFMDAFTNHFAVVGQRREGTGPVDFIVAGPDHASAAEAGRVIHAPGNDAWLFCRCIVDGPDDLPQSHAMQDTIHVSSSAPDNSSDRVQPVSPISAQNFLDVVNEFLARNPVPAAEQALLESWQRIGLRPGVRGVWHDLAPDMRAAWESTISETQASLKTAGKQGRREVAGWIGAASDIGNFGDNYMLRASVALGGLGALEPDEAMYFVKYQDENGEMLDGGRNYVLKVPATGIPTNSFWSFTMYAATEDGRRVLVENPISRFSVGNRTPGIAPNPDGSLDIALQSRTPAEPELVANWLPTPAAGPFQIALRTYLPRDELKDGTAKLPQIIRSAD